MQYKDALGQILLLSSWLYCAAQQTVAGEQQAGGIVTDRSQCAVYIAPELSALSYDELSADVQSVAYNVIIDNDDDRMVVDIAIASTRFGILHHMVDCGDNELIDCSDNNVRTCVELAYFGTNIFKGIPSASK